MLQTRIWMASMTHPILWHCRYTSILTGLVLLSLSGSFTYSLRLYETMREDERAEIVWRWGRVEGQPRVFNDRPGVVYIWQ
ncbi:hypothetical protein BGW80DRAFT_1321707 [Lactifluus volemus]|nr:hypothetical protein BGW80DRAFT_1321707 [Lactifluus volemus]